MRFLGSRIFLDSLVVLRFIAVTTAGLLLILLSVLLIFAWALILAATAIGGSILTIRLFAPVRLFVSVRFVLTFRLTSTDWHL